MFLKPALLFHIFWQSFQLVLLHNNHSKLGLRYNNNLFSSHIYKNLGLGSSSSSLIDIDGVA